MERPKADLLITELGSKLGVADLTLDAFGRTGLTIDDGAMVLRIAFDEASGGFDVSAPLSEVEPTPARLARALSASFCWRPAAGGTFGLDPGRNELALRRHCPDAGLDASGLLEVLGSLVTQAEDWTKALHEIEPAMPAGREDARMPMGGLRG